MMKCNRNERPVGRNKLAQFRHRGGAFAVGLPELRKLVPAYIFGPTGLRSRDYFFAAWIFGSYLTSRTLSTKYFPGGQNGYSKTRT